MFGKGALGGGECWEEQKGEAFCFQAHYIILSVEF